jgi:hypothetical protein
VFFSSRRWKKKFDSERNFPQIIFPNHTHLSLCLWFITLKKNSPYLYFILFNFFLFIPSKLSALIICVTSSLFLCLAYYITLKTKTRKWWKTTKHGTFYK